MSDNPYKLKLYMAGITPDNQNMILNFKEQLNEKLGDQSFSLEVIDVLERPELAEEEKILATPTVVRSLPGPIKKFILDLNDTNSTLIGLDLIASDTDS